MNKFEDYFFNKEKVCKVHKWHHYFKIYDRHFSKFIGKNPVILEIGVYHGGSLEMLNHYFDNKCRIYGLDINCECLKVPFTLKATNITVVIGDQGSREFWREFLKKTPKFDIVIDDGGHTMNQQIVTHEEVYDHISDNGVYLCEALHTSYMTDYGGGLNKPTTFIEYSKSFIDMIHFFYIKEDLQEKKQLYEKFRRTTDSIHYYDSVIVLEKKIDLHEPTASFR